MRSSASHPAGLHGRFAQNGESGPHCWEREDLSQFAQQFVNAVTAPPPVGCVILNLRKTSYGISYGCYNGPQCASFLTNTYLVLKMSSGANYLGAVCADVGMGVDSL